MQDEADNEMQSLQQQLTNMEEVRGQLDSTAKALQGRAELQQQEIEVLQMELLAKDKALALRQALAESSAESAVCLLTGNMSETFHNDE